MPTIGRCISALYPFEGRYSPIPMFILFIAAGAEVYPPPWRTLTGYHHRGCRGLSSAIPPLPSLILLPLADALLYPLPCRSASSLPPSPSITSALPHRLHLAPPSEGRPHHLPRCRSSSTPPQKTSFVRLAAQNKGHPRRRRHCRVLSAPMPPVKG